MNRRCALRLHYDACHEVSVRLRGTKQVRSQLAQELMPVPRCRDTTPRDSQGIRRADEPRPTRGTVRTLRRRRISGELAVSVTDEKPRSDADRQRTLSTSTGPGEGGAPVEIIGRGLARRPLSTLETRRRQAIPPALLVRSGRDCSGRNLHRRRDGHNSRWDERDFERRSVHLCVVGAEFRRAYDLVSRTC